MGSTGVPPIGARLRDERLRRGISVRGLAREIGVSASLISQIETDKSSPSVSTLYAITTALDISIEDIFARGRTIPGRDGVQPDPGTGGPLEGADRGVPPQTPPDGGPGPDGDAGPDRGAGPDGDAGAADDQAGGADDEAGRARRAGLVLPGTAGHRPLEPARDRRVGPVVTPPEREVLTLDSGVTWELLGQIPDKHVDFLLITYQPGGTSSNSGLLMRHSGTEYGYVISGALTLTLGFEVHRLSAGDAVSFDSTTPHAYRNEGTVPAVGVWFVLERST